MSDHQSERTTISYDRPDLAPAPMAIAEHFPQLEIIEVLGRGGMGIVYKARQKGLDRLVALKILPPSSEHDERFAERFAREARALARLQHPNIVTVHDSGRAGELFYFIMEYVDGANLRQLMRGGTLDTAQALSIVPPVCEALQYAHDEGVMHRDIKPENILVDTRGRVKIADFGLAKLIAGPKTDYTLTAPQQIMGTMHYMAPEQVEHPGDVDHRADIYALGVVLYELLTGELPIGRFPLPSERSPVDPRLDQIVLHALEKEPARRYQRFSDVKTDVEAVSAEAHRGLRAPVMQGGAAAMSAPAVSAGSSIGPGFAAGMLPSTPMEGQRSPGTAYLLWLLCFLGEAGIHRMYAGKWITGILWLLTGGVFMIGQLVDLFLIPGMIRLNNLERAYLERELAMARSPHIDPDVARIV